MRAPLRLVAVAAAPAGTIVAPADGQEVYRATLANLGSTGGALQIGSDAKRQPFTLITDDIRMEPQ